MTCAPPQRLWPRRTLCWIIVDDSIDQANKDTVTALINEAREAGAAIVAICHDAPVRDAIATRLFDVTDFAANPAEAAA